MSLLLSHGHGFKSLITNLTIKNVLIETSRHHGLKGKHIITSEMFSRDQLALVFQTADECKQMICKGSSLNIMRGKILAAVFYEVSTRTRNSFSAAMQRLGGGVIYMDNQMSSVKKGETFEDSIRMMSGYSDVIALRHPKPGAACRASNHTGGKPLINAGDGIGEHPTQAVLDIYTIIQELGEVDGKVITMVGDMKNGRTVHSLAKLLTVYDICRLNYVSPKNLRMPDKVKRYVEYKGVKQKEYDKLDKVLPDTDVLYMTRVQKERFKSEEEYKKAMGHYIINLEMMCKAKSEMTVLHPLPRVNEISTDFDTDPRAAYFRQAANGMYVRMALISMVMGAC